MLINGEPINLPFSFLDRLNDGLGMFAMRFAASRYKMRLQDLIGSKPNCAVAGRKRSEVDRFSYLGSVSHLVMVHRKKCLRA